MTDFRAELQALVSAYDKHGGRWRQEDEVALLAAVERARAALAQPEPEAEPTLREEFTMILNEARCSSPRVIGNIELGRRLVAAVERFNRAQPEPEGPTDEDLRDLAEAAGMSDPEPADSNYDPMFLGSLPSLRDFARAVLARWGRPTPQPTADGEVAELADWLRDAAEQAAAADWVTDAWWLTRAADLLSRLSPPQPIPVSERLPGDALSWWYEPDEDDDPTGYGGNWTLLRIRGNVSFYTHWLPAHALPAPQP